MTEIENPTVLSDEEATDMKYKANIYTNISTLLHEARKKVKTTVNTIMVYTYFEIGKMILEEEQNGKERADYGKSLLKALSSRLTEEFGKGFSVRNIEQMRKFYLIYSKPQKVSAKFKLSWSHYIKLCRIKNSEERNFYEIESINNNWSLKELNRQFDSALYERLLLSRNKEEIKKLSTHGEIIENPRDLVKDPYILEFLGLDEMANYSENEYLTILPSKEELKKIVEEVRND